MTFRYGLDDRPPLWESILVGLQWCALLVPWIIIFGKVAAGFHFGAGDGETVYLQKLFFIAAVLLLIEVLAGHRLPLLFGPSAVVLIGIITSHGFDTASIYTSVLAGSLLLTACAVSGFFGALRRLFTTRVVVVVLLLVTFCMMPTVIRLVTDTTAGVPVTANLLFALSLLLAMMALHRLLSGVGRSTLIVTGMFTAAVVYFFIFPETFHTEAIGKAAPLASFFSGLTTRLAFDAGLILSFIVCYIALAINDLGSIQSMNALADPPDAEKRIDRGVVITGFGNLAAGFLGVIGQVNYSLSLGVVLASGSLSRWTLIPAAAILLGIGFSPKAIAFLGNVPPAVIGGVLAYILSTQVAGGLTVLFGAPDRPEFNDLLVVGMPLILAVAVAFLPEPAVASLPRLIRPIAGNSFAMGVLAVLLLEHVVFRK
jgi:xanthine/uracil permease